MNSVNRLLSVSIVLLSLFSPVVSFSQEDHVSIKRIVGDFYDITISGERDGESTNVQRVITNRIKSIYNYRLLLGDYPVLAIYAFVESEGNSTTKNKYSFTFQEELEW